MSKNPSKNHKKSFKLYSLKTIWKQFHVDLDNSYEDFFHANYETATGVHKYEMLFFEIKDALKKNTPAKKQSTPSLIITQFHSGIQNATY